MTSPSESPAAGDPPIRSIYVDESGVLATSERSGRFFVVAAITTSAPKAVIRRLKRQKAALIRSGWPRNVEIKGNALWRSAHDTRVPPDVAARNTTVIAEMIGEICAAPITVRYAVLDKELARADPRIASEAAFEATVASLVVADRRQHPASHWAIIVDQRSKEPKDHQRFREAVEQASSGELTAKNLTVEHLDSRRSVGLQAVDILSWAIFRAHEHGDTRFLSVLPAGKLWEHPWRSA